MTPGVRKSFVIELTQAQLRWLKGRACDAEYVSPEIDELASRIKHLTWKAGK